MSAVLALIAMAIATLGVFGFNTFEMRRRTGDIGIRKALGPGPLTIVGAVVRQEVLFAGGASLLGWPVGLSLAKRWVSSFVYQSPLPPGIAPLASAVALTAIALWVALSSAAGEAVRPSSARIV